MNNERNDYYEIHMTGSKSRAGEMPEENLQNYFSKPELDLQDGRDWNSQRQKEKIENFSGITPNVPDSHENTWDLNEHDDDSKPRTDNGDDSDDGKIKKLIAVLIASLAVIILAVLFWPCSHVWTEATCTTAKTCSKCEKTEGAALGHQWKEATCVDPSVCSRCKKTSGTALGHTWQQITEKDCVDAKIVSYSLCAACDKKENQTTKRLTSMLSADGKTFLITPVELGERMNAMCAEQNLNLTCFWADKVDGEGNPGIEIKAGSDLAAVIWLYEGSNRENLENINASDKNKKSLFSMAQLVMDIGYSEPDALLTAFVMAIDPAYQNNPEGAHEVAIKAFQLMLERVMYEDGDTVYSMISMDGLLVLHAYTRKMFE